MADTLVENPKQILENMLRTYRAAMQEAGVSDPAVGVGSDIFIIASMVANELSIAMNNTVISAEANMPDSATGEDLDRVLATYGLTRRPASTGSGFIELVTTTATLVPAGTELLSNAGLTYATVTSGTYANGAELEIVSVDAGAAVNLDEGEVLKWRSPPAFAAPKVEVSQAVTGAVDAESDEVARARLLGRFASPPSMGNWQAVAELAEAQDAAVQKAFVYPAHNGPSTLAVALCANPTETSKSRQLTSTKVTQISSGILGNMPEYVSITINSVVDVTNNVSFGITIPFPEGAANNGTGGGWLNFNAFPAANGTTHTKCIVSAVTNSTSFTIDAPIDLPPTEGITKISWIDRTDYTVKTATILTTSGTGPYVVTVDAPFTGVAVNDYVFPACKNAQVYLDAVLAQFAKLGPGQVTDQASVLPKAYRRPLTSVAFPNKLDGSMQKAITDSSTEVQSTSYFYRTSSSSPSLPASVNSGPYIYVPGQISFYPEV
jgi:uncharacterized phage protein gp47/JayE